MPVTFLKQLVNNNKSEYLLTDHSTGDTYTIDPNSTENVGSVTIPVCINGEQYELNHFTLRNKSNSESWYIWVDGQDIKLSKTNSYSSTASALPGLAGNAGKKIKIIFPDEVSILGEIDTDLH